MPSISRPGSVWAGDDARLLAWMIPFYWRGEGEEKRGKTPRVLDVTYGRGTFWRGATAPVVAIDRLPTRPGVIPMDNRALGFQGESFDVVIYDPPHITDSSPRGAYASRYGVETREAPAAQFPRFLTEAARVLTDGGVVLAKIADMVHSGRAQWQHVDFMVAAREHFTVCDLIVKTRRGAMNDPKWKRVLHARKGHCFWIVLRKGEC